MKAIITKHQRGLQIGDAVEVLPSILRVKGIFVRCLDGTKAYLRTGYVLIPTEAGQVICESSMRALGSG